MKTCFVVACLFLVIYCPIVSAKRKEPSRNLYRFLSLVSGYFNNIDQQSTDQCTSGLDYHENVTILWKPVHIESLKDKFTLYSEVTIAGMFSGNEIWVVSEDRCGVIHVQPLNILDQPVELDHVDFDHIRLEPQTNKSGCEILFYSVDLDVFVGTLPGCFGGTTGPSGLPVFGITFSCYSVSYHVCNIEFFQKRPILPYIYFKQYSYPLTKDMTEGSQFETSCYYRHY